MPWREVSKMSQRLEFVMLAGVEGACFGELCARFGISRKTGYKWLARYDDGGTEGLVERSRRPLLSPRRSSDEIEAAVLEVRNKHPAWGGRKIAAVLRKDGVRGVPSPSTITRILHRHGRITPEASAAAKAFVRFEAAAPNDLWQMDFKGHFATQEGRCHPLTVLDDHSRFVVGLEACRNEQERTVRDCLQRIFEKYGLPLRILADNGSPWGGMYPGDYTGLEVWLLRLNVVLIHGRPFHPQTQGKDERFHRTLAAEVIKGREWKDIPECRKAFAHWRGTYNVERPHEALDMQAPVSRYCVSPRSMPSALPPVEYGPDDLVRRVDGSGRISMRNQPIRVGSGFSGELVGLRPTLQDGVFAVYFCRTRLGLIDLTAEEPSLKRESGKSKGVHAG